MPCDATSPPKPPDGPIGFARNRRTLWIARFLLVVVPALLFLGLGEALLWALGTARLVDHPGFHADDRMHECRSAPEKIDRLCAAENFTEDGSRISVFVYGGSSVEGYPLFEMMPFPNRMQRMLDREFPNTYSVHNLGASCRDSIYVRKCAGKVHGKPSDFYVIYSGHNDIANFVVPNPRIRILSIEYPWLISIQANLAKSRIYSGLSNLIRSRKFEFTGVKRRLENPQWGIARRIALDEYEQNILSVINTALDLDISVIMVTMVSNTHEYPQKRGDWAEKILNPIAAYPEHFQPWYRHFKAGIEFFEAEELEKALREFHLARDEYMGGRAPSALNERIRAFAAKYPHVHLVDFETTLDRLALREGVGVGCNFFGTEEWCDQFHPNARTQHLLAHEIVKKLRVLRRSAAQN